MSDGRFKRGWSRGFGVGAYNDFKVAEKGEPVIVTPPIEDYSGQLQAAAAAELKRSPINFHGTRSTSAVALH